MGCDITALDETTLQAVHALFCERLPQECWSKDALKKQIDHPNDRVLVAKIADTVVGLIQLHHLPPEGELLNIAVSTSVARQGVATALLEAMCQEGMTRGIGCYFLEVRAQNQAAIDCYARFGFYEVGKRPRFYKDPVDDAVLYRLDLPRDNLS